MLNCGAMTGLEVGHTCHIGMVRDSNEDRVLVLDLSPPGLLSENPLALFAVADGVGGCQGGEIASELALRVIGEAIAEALSQVAEAGEPLERCDQKHLHMVLAEGVKKANWAVVDQGQARGKGMATTLVAALICGGSVHIANVGDSRAYLLGQVEFRQVTDDHSVVSALVSAGVITRDEAYTHPKRNIITRSVGMGGDLEVDLFAEELPPDSSLLLCSDGLWEMVKDGDIRRILLESSSSQSACDELVEMANRNGGTDNISVLVIRRKPGAGDC